MNKTLNSPEHPWLLDLLAPVSPLIEWFGHALDATPHVLRAEVQHEARDN